jgi:hypothetical protein
MGKEALRKCEQSEKSNYLKILEVWESRIKKQCCSGVPCGKKCPRYGL